MKRFILHLGIFAIMMVACDIAVGYVGNHLVTHSKGGDTNRKNNIANRANEDVLIFGSSRAIHHYDPNILEEVFNMPSYNCGFDGNGIICAFGYIKMIEQRYCPKMIIYDIIPSFDLLASDNHTYLGQLRYYYDRDDIDSIFWSVDVAERYKMVSTMYRFNSMLPQLIMDNISPLHSDNKGYRPLDGEMSDNIKPLKEQTNITYDRLKLHYIERLIEDCRGKTLLVFAVSPMYENTDNEVLAPIKVLCEEYEVPLLNHYTDTSFNYTREYFSDRSHLNRRGATEYSRVIASEIKQMLEKR